MDDVPTTLVLPSEEGKDAKDASPPLAVQRDSRRSVRRQRSKLAAVAWELERRQTASRSVRWTRAQVVSHVLLFLYTLARIVANFCFGTLAQLIALRLSIGSALSLISTRGLLFASLSPAGVLFSMIPTLDVGLQTLFVLLMCGMIGPKGWDRPMETFRKLADLSGFGLAAKRIAFPGKIILSALDCIVSFPGKYSKEWDAAALKIAEERCRQNGCRAPWGCSWFEEWRKNVEEAMRLGQKLHVFYFEGKVGRGKLAWPKLCDSMAKEEARRDSGLGASQTAEVAYLEKMGLEYEEHDITEFEAFLRKCHTWASPRAGVHPAPNRGATCAASMH
eukprot:g23857.t1